eukprot:gene13922-16447_t
MTAPNKRFHGVGEVDPATGERRLSKREKAERYGKRFKAGYVELNREHLGGDREQAWRDEARLQVDVHDPVAMHVARRRPAAGRRALGDNALLLRALCVWRRPRRAAQGWCSGGKVVAISDDGTYAIEMPDGAIGKEWLQCNVRLPGGPAVEEAAAKAPHIEDDVGQAASQIDQGAADAAGPEPAPPPQPAY